VTHSRDLFQGESLKEILVQDIYLKYEKRANKTNNNNNNNNNPARE
jgi:hypothetical protein